LQLVTFSIFDRTASLINPLSFVTHVHYISVSLLLQKSGKKPKEVTPYKISVYSKELSGLKKNAIGFNS